MHFLFSCCHGWLAYCRAAVRWVCGPAVRRYGQQAVDGSLYFASLLACDLIEKSAKVTTYYFYYFILGKTHFHHCLCYRGKETIWLIFPCNICFPTNTFVRAFGNCHFSISSNTDVVSPDDINHCSDILSIFKRRTGKVRPNTNKATSICYNFCLFLTN